MVSLRYLREGNNDGQSLTGAEDDLMPLVSLLAWPAVGLDGDTYMRVFRETELEFEEMSRVP